MSELHLYEGFDPKKSFKNIMGGITKHSEKKIQFEFSQHDKHMILKTLGTFRGLQSLPALVEFSWHLQDDMKYLDTSLQMTFPIIVYPSSPAIDEGNEWDPLQKVFTNFAFLVNTHYAGTFTSVRKEGNNNILTIKV